MAVLLAVVLLPYGMIFKTVAILIAGPITPFLIPYILISIAAERRKKRWKTFFQTLFYWLVPILNPD